MSLPLPKTDLAALWAETCQQSGLHCQVLEGTGFVGSLLTPAWNMAANTHPHPCIEMPALDASSLTPPPALASPGADVAHAPSVATRRPSSLGLS